MRSGAETETGAIDVAAPGFAPGPLAARALVMGAERHRGGYERFVKPVVDRLIGAILALVTLPVLLLLLVFTWLDIGMPLLSRDRRVGRNGKVFLLAKIRTLDESRLGAVAMAAEVGDLDDDPRLSRLGRLLRKTSLDELPQLWNVVLGSMSLIGPRPERLEIVEQFEPWQHRRHQVKPGITGLWQVTARGDGRVMRDNTPMDIDYVDRLSFLTDLKIVLKTVPALLRRREGPDHSAGPDTGSWRRTVRLSAYLFTKRLVDVITSLLGFLILSPLLLVIAVAIRIDSPGLPLFRQARVGYHGQIFRMLKFRSMHQHADETLHRQHYARLAAERNGDGGEGNSVPIRIHDDPRVTGTGGFLRKWSLDEIPNLWNVLKGEMSLVGPRPFVPYEVDLHNESELRRLDAKPGVTGLAQVMGRLDISMEERAGYDLEYLERRSLVLDLRIILKTAAALVRRHGD